MIGEKHQGRAVRKAAIFRPSGMVQLVAGVARTVRLAGSWALNG
jgi:hypothetical protein